MANRRTRRLKKFENFAAHAPVKPTTKPGTIPHPGKRQTPTRKTKPGVDPGTKGTIKQVVDKYIDLLLQQPVEMKSKMLDIFKANNNPAPVKPGVKPDIIPHPGKRPTPTRKDKPGVDPKPKGMYENLITSFKVFEASLEDNPGIPSGLTSRLEDEGQRASKDAGITQQSGMELMQLSQQAIQLQDGHEKEIEQVVYDGVIQLYGDLLGEAELKVKLVKPGEAADMMEEAEDEEDPEFEEIEDEDLKNKIHMRKIANSLIQGESKNIFRIIEMPEFRDAIVDINPQLYEVYRRIAEINEHFHWNIPMEVMAQMWKEHPEGQAGAVKVKFEDKEDKEAEEEKPERSIEDLLADIESGEDMASAEEADEPMEGKILAVGIDAVVLIHEAVKGILELIAAHTLPDDEEEAKIVSMNVDSIDNEIEDLRYGPAIAGKLRDAVNNCPDSGYDVNIRFHVMGKMFQMEPVEFLALMNGILSDESKNLGDLCKLVQDTANELKEYDDKLKQYDAEISMQDDDDGDEYSSNVDIDALTKDEPEPSKSSSAKSYSDPGMSQAEKQSLLDDALDRGDYELAHKISKYIR